LSEEPRDAEVLERDAARVYAVDRGFKQVEIDRELPEAVGGTIEVTKRGVRALHRVTEFEYMRAGGTLAGGD